MLLLLLITITVLYPSIVLGTNLRIQPTPDTSGDESKQIHERPAIVSNSPNPDTLLFPPQWNDEESFLRNLCIARSPTNEPEQVRAVHLQRSAYNPSQERHLVVTGPEMELKTTMAAGNGFYGVMFDVRAKTDIVVETLSCNIKVQDTVAVSIYSKLGTFLEDSFDPGRWTKVVNNKPVKAMGEGLYTTIPRGFFSQVPIPKNATQAFYITINVPMLQYSNANRFSAMGDVFASNDDLDVLIGMGLGELDGFLSGVIQVTEKKIPNRLWNGKVHYAYPMNVENDDGVTNTDGTGDQNGIFGRAYQWVSNALTPMTSFSLQTSFDSTNSGYGIMFEVQATPTYGVIVTSMDLHIGTADSQMVSVYTLEGTFEGHEHDPNAWKRIFSGSGVIGAGKGSSTHLDPSAFSAVKIYPGALQSFYVVLDQPNLQYSNGKELHSIIAQDSHLMVREGVGIDRAFGSTNGNRMFSGVFYYDASEPDGSVFGNGLVTTVGVPKTITTSFSGKNFAYGNMFDVIVLEDIQVLSLDVHLQTTATIEVKVYTRTGRHMGYELLPAEWTLICDATIQGKGNGVPTPIPPERFSKLALLSGTRQAFYVTVSDAILRYNDGTDLDQVFVQNGAMKVLEGSALARPYFGGVFAPRIFNGNIHYQRVGTPDASRSYGDGGTQDIVSEATGQLNVLKLTMNGSNGSYGAMFDVVAIREVSIEGFDIHTRIQDQSIDVKVYTKEGSYVGYELDRGVGIDTVWKVALESTNVAGYGMYRRTPLPDFPDAITIMSGHMQAFYVVARTAEICYDDGHLVDAGKVVAEDENLQVMEGIGIGEGTQYFAPRVFNGAVRYLPTIGLVA